MKDLIGLILISTSSMTYAKFSDRLDTLSLLGAFCALVGCFAYGYYLIKKPSTKKTNEKIEEGGKPIFSPVKGDKVAVGDGHNLWFARILHHINDDGTFVTYYDTETQADSPLTRWKYCEPFEKHFPN